MSLLRTLLLVPLLAIAACGGGDESLYQETKDTLVELVDTLESIRSKADYDKAKPKLDELGERLAELGKESEDLPAETQAEYRKRFEEELGDLKTRMLAGFGKAAQFEATGALEDLMGGFGR